MLAYLSRMISGQVVFMLLERWGGCVSVTDAAVHPGLTSCRSVHCISMSIAVVTLMFLTVSKPPTLTLLSHVPQTFIYLSEFLVSLLPTVGPTLFRPWASTLICELIAMSFDRCAQT